MNNQLIKENEKLKLFKKYGYDIPKARNFIPAKARPIQGQVLEVGTGRGQTAVALASRGIKLTSIDLDKKAQSAARLNLKIMNAEKLIYPDNCFNSVISVNFIHHANHPGKCIDEMIRVTKEKLVIADIVSQFTQGRT
jgi:ubiquinone/menaquinone biosynthesis C-methylase UbiE